MKIYKSITFKLFLFLSLILAVFMCIIVYVQVFIIGRTYSISEYTLEKERLLSPLIYQFVSRSMTSGVNSSTLYDMDGFERANNVNLIIFNEKLGATYTVNTKKTLDSYYISYIRGRLHPSNYYDKQVAADSFRIYDRLGLPTEYIAYVTPAYTSAGMQHIVSIIPEVFTTRTSGILKGYIVYIFLFMIILILSVSALFSYFVTKPVVKISRTASRIADLNFSQKCEVRHEDEIGDLGKTINNMSIKLKDTIENLSHANERLQKDLDLRKELDLLRKEFIGAVTHEFKTPITLIRGYTESIRDNVAEGLEKESALDTIIEETERMDKLVRDLLDLSKLESMGYSLNITEFNINDLLYKISSKYEKVMSGRDIVFVKDIAFDKLVSGDPFRIEQVVSNFLNNALDNTSPGNAITLALKNMGSHVRISVHNEGKSIPEDEQKRVWEKFYRVEKSRNKKLGGTGLGLAISKSILELHKSSYGIKNTPSGVEFFFTLNTIEHKADI